MTVLIVTGMDDVHADAVIPLLEQADEQVVRLNTDNFADNATFTIDSQGWTGAFELRDSARSLALDEVTSVWYRKPVPIKPRPDLAFAPARDFAAGEYEAFLRCLYGLLADKFWISDYWRIRAASQKLPNLRIAAQLGLRTPRTMVTTNDADARRFAEDCGWSLLAKPFALTTFKTQAETHTSWDSFSTKVNFDTFERLAPSLALAPTLLQQYVDKLVELRVTIVGRSLFCTSIDSQKHAFAQEDWRAVDVEELAHQEFNLPLGIAEKLLAFNHRHGLEFSTHDLIVDRAGDFVWLECNPNGQWLWIEELTGQPIARAISDLLIDPENHALR
jgi:glutathione synthase/RimK-type ligase-like ATP-grasp enzyme